MRWRRDPAGGGVRQGKNARSDMVSHQLRSRDISDPRVLAAMGRVPREKFVPEGARGLAYADEALAIGSGQTISQPYMVAVMTQEMRLSGGEKVLEIGTGSGYQTAILAELCQEVYTVERIAELSERAQEALSELEYGNVRFRVDDGTLGWPEEAPFDAIMVTAAGPRIPAPLVEQVREGGRIVMPVGDRYSQALLAASKAGDRMEEVSVCRCVFVPLIGESGWEG